MPPDPATTQELRLEQLRREHQERKQAEQADAEAAEAAATRRADKAAYLREKLDEQAESQQER